MGTTPEETVSSSPDATASASADTSGPPTGRSRCAPRNGCHGPGRRKNRLLRGILMLAVLVGVPFLVARASVRHCHAHIPATQEATQQR